MLNNEIYGLIHDYYPIQRMISIESRGKLLFFYASKTAVKIISTAMKHKSVFIYFEYGEKTKVIKSAVAHEITTINLIKFASKRGLKTIFDKSKEKKNISDIINEKTYKCFLDFEFSMPPFQYVKTFTTEIIQIGLVVVDENDEVVDMYSQYVKPNEPISDRTIKFLCIDPLAYKIAVEYDEFYERYKEIIKAYKPVVYVWGANDVKILNSSYKLHRRKEIKARYQDLMRLHKLFFETKNDLGLFNALKLYKGLEVGQAHFALTDATATKEVFDGFKRVINGLQVIDLKNEAFTEDGE